MSSGESGSGTLHPFVSQETDEWSTPADFVRPVADAIGGFDLDPCSGAEDTPIASETYTEEDDGLSQPWFGDVWMNPPYSELEEWTEKAVNEVRNGDAKSVIALVKGDTSTDWYQEAAVHADTLVFVDGRLQFGNSGDNAPFPSHVLIFGSVPDQVLDVLDHHGVVVSCECLKRTKQETIV